MKILSFANRKGGCGKSTALALLALSWAEKGHTVGVIDRDKLKASYAFVEALQHPRIARYNLRKSVDFILTDSSGGIDEKEMKLLQEESDLVLIPVTLSPQDLRGTAETTAYLSSTHNVRLLLNSVDTRTAVFRQRAELLAMVTDSTGQPVPHLNTYLTRRAAYGYATAEGWSMLHEVALGELEALTREINALLAGLTAAED